MDVLVPRGICVSNHFEDEARGGAHGHSDPGTWVSDHHRSHALNRLEEEIHGGAHGHHTDHTATRHGSEHPRQSDSLTAFMGPAICAAHMVRLSALAFQTWAELGRRNAELAFGVPIWAMARTSSRRSASRLN